MQKVYDEKNYIIGELEKTIMRAARVFCELSDSEFESVLIRGVARRERYERGVTVAEAESKQSEFMILLTGRIQGVRDHEDGKQDFVQLFVPGEVCGLDIVCSVTRRCPFRLQALDECDLVFINYDGIFCDNISRAEERNLRKGITQALANESLRRLHKIDVLYRKALRERVLVYLRNLSIITGSTSLELNMDREQFAQYLGVNRSALSHELANMRNDGLIEFYKSSFKILKDM